MTAVTELAMFVTHFTDCECKVKTSYRLARLADVQAAHVAMKAAIEDDSDYDSDDDDEGDYTDRDDFAVAFGFLFSPFDYVRNDPRIERGRMEAKRLFVSVTEHVPVEDLDNCVISKFYSVKTGSSPRSSSPPTSPRTKLMRRCKGPGDTVHDNCKPWEVEMSR